MPYILIVSATNTDIPPLGQANHQLTAVDTPEAHHLHPHPLPRPPNRFHHPRQTAGEIPGQRSPNPQDGHALRLAYPPRTPPRLQFLAMVRYRLSLPVVTRRVPRHKHQTQAKLQMTGRRIRLYDQQCSSNSHWAFRRSKQCKDSRACPGSYMLACPRCAR